MKNMITDELICDVNNDIKDIFRYYDEIEEYNTVKVLDAFKENAISEAHLNGTSGYGYGDLGRDAIERIYSKIFGAEDAIVRTQFISGTHTISVALFGILRPGDTVLSINGKPYDTLDEVIGIRDNPSSLKSFGVKYEQVDMVNNGFDLDGVKEKLENHTIKMIMIQRSRGYANRDSFTVEKIEEVISLIKKVSPLTIVMVDNCYGEFTDKLEPSNVGADIIVGSLIKNIGGGIAPTGGYIAGRKDLIELISDRYSAPGLGKEGGATFSFNRQILQGLFVAPHVVNQSLKVAIFSARIFEKLGYDVVPKFDAKRSDIVQSIIFNDEKKLIEFCQGIQKNSPVDSHVVPMPWDMPGYENKVIMASGSFTSGSSIELSCDGPIRAPYIAFLQGSLTYAHGKYAVIEVLKGMERE